MSDPLSDSVTDAEHIDVLIIGAGISGINAAYHLSTQLPDRSFVVLDALESFGGTWLTHTFPGVRSDTELFTLGYEFNLGRALPMPAGPRSTPTWAKSSRRTTSAATSGISTRSPTPDGRLKRSAGRSPAAAAIPASRSP